jgi:hypothetical protein
LFTDDPFPLDLANESGRIKYVPFPSQQLHGVVPKVENAHTIAEDKPFFCRAGVIPLVKGFHAYFDAISY